MSERPLGGDPARPDPEVPPGGATRTEVANARGHRRRTGHPPESLDGSALGDGRVKPGIVDTLVDRELRCVERLVRTVRLQELRALGHTSHRENDRHAERDPTPR